MPDRFIPMSESEQRFADLLERVFTDEEFAASMSADPQATLQAAGFELDESQVAAIREAQRFEEPEGMPEDQLAIPLTKPLVSIVTKGTKPAVRVVTKGTSPAVSVAVNTVIFVEESTAPELEVVPEERAISRIPREDHEETQGSERGA